MDVIKKSLGMLSLDQRHTEHDAVEVVVTFLHKDVQGVPALQLYQGLAHKEERVMPRIYDKVLIVR